MTQRGRNNKSIPPEGIQETRVTDPSLVQCWSTVYDAGPTLNQQWVNDWVQNLMNLHGVGPLWP